MPRADGLPELDVTAWSADWRDDWQVREHGTPRPHAWHRSGICVVFEFEQIDEHGNWAWLVYDDVLAVGRSYEVRTEMGEQAFAKFWSVLERQASLLWRELGHSDFSLNDRT